MGKKKKNHNHRRQGGGTSAPKKEGSVGNEGERKMPVPPPCEPGPLSPPPPQLPLPPPSPPLPAPCTPEGVQWATPRSLTPPKLLLANNSPNTFRNPVRNHHIASMQERLLHTTVRTASFSKWRRWARHMSGIRVVPRHHLLRFLIDSREADSGVVCWIPVVERRSFLFVAYPSSKPPVDISGWLTRKLRLLLIGEDPYELAEGDGGVLLFEIPFSSVTGMDYSNNLTSDGRWAIEAKEVLRWYFPSDAEMFDFVSGDVLPAACVVLAAAAVCAKRHRSLPFLHLACDAGGATPPAPLPVPFYFEYPPSPASNPDMNADGNDGSNSSPLPWLSLCLPRPQPLQPPPYLTRLTSVKTNMVVAYFGDSAPQLPLELWSLLKRTENSKQLKMVESGLPSWAVFLPQRNLYYRRWLRIVVQTVVVLWPIITLIAALVDLYRSFETIRSLVNYISGFFYAVHDSVLSVVEAAGKYFLQPVFDIIWAVLSDWWRMVVMQVLEVVSGWAATAVFAVQYLTDCVRVTPLFSLLAETRAYFVSMLLPYCADLITAVAAACRLWVQVISSTWSVVSGSLLAVWRMVGSFAKMPKWVGDSVGLFFAYASAGFASIGRFFGAVFSVLRSAPLPSWLKLKETVNTTNETAVRWNIARNTITGVVSRTWNLSIFIGTEISKHWVTWVVRPANYLLEWVQKHWKGILACIVALLPFGVISHVFSHGLKEFASRSTSHEVFQDILLYQACVFVVWYSFPLLGRLKELCRSEPVQDTAFAAVVCYVLAIEVAFLPPEASLQVAVLVVATSLVFSFFVWRVSRWLLARIAEAQTPTKVASLSPLLPQRLSATATTPPFHRISPAASPQLQSSRVFSSSLSSLPRVCSDFILPSQADLRLRRKRSYSSIVV